MNPSTVLSQSVAALLVLTSLAGSTLTAQSPVPPPASSVVDPNAAARLQQLGKRGIRVHDPSTIVQCKDRYWLSMHFYDGTTPRGTSALAIRPLKWNSDGWPMVE